MECIVVIATTVIAIFTGCLWWSTKKLWKTTEKSSEAAKTAAKAATDSVLIAKDTAQRELRAYVYLDIKIRPYPPGAANRYSISLTIINVGKIWATNLQILKGIITQEQSKGGEPFDFLQWDGNASSPIALGPGQELNLQFGDVWFSTIEDIASQKTGYDYVAWIKYKDSVSPPTTIWQTQLSKHLNGDTEGGISFSTRSTHNCVDEDCY